MLNGLSLTATFGALVWIFQDGHLGAFGTTPTGTLVVTMPALLFCIAFRAVDGLRSVPGVANPRILAGVQPAPLPTTTKAWRSGWPTPAG